MNAFAWIAQLIMGYVWQWMRAPKQMPNWVSYTAGAAVSALVYWWLTPDALDVARADWRVFVGQLVTFFLAARGSAAILKDGKAAPATNSL